LTLFLHNSHTTRNLSIVHQCGTMP